MNNALQYAASISGAVGKTASRTAIFCRQGVSPLLCRRDRMFNFTLSCYRRTRTHQSTCDPENALFQVRELFSGQPRTAHNSHKILQCLGDGLRRLRSLQTSPRIFLRCPCPTKMGSGLMDGSREVLQNKIRSQYDYHEQTFARKGPLWVFALTRERWRACGMKGHEAIYK